MPVLEIRDIRVEYRRSGRSTVRAVGGVSLSVERAEILGLVGETGSGKSSLARAAVGLEPVQSGSIWFEGRRLVPLSFRRRPRADTRLQLVFQNPYSSLNPRRKIGAQLGDAVSAIGLAHSDEKTKRVHKLLEDVGLPADAANRHPHQFSGGQRQRIAIARALAADPAAIVMDEPLSALDASAQADIANLLLTLSRTKQLAILLISHDLGVVRQIADTIAVMYLGLVVETGPVMDVWSTPKHPYTQALINSIPSIDHSGELPMALPGAIPDPANPPRGCHFHPRCPKAFDLCSVEAPPLVRVAGSRQVSCWLEPECMTAGGRGASSEATA